MLELLKKLGVPATVAAVVATLVTVVPLLFKVDGRYAKEEDVNSHLLQVTSQISALTTEVGQLAGTQQVLVTLIAAQSKVAITPPVSAVPTTPSNIQRPIVVDEDAVDVGALPAPKNSQEMHDQLMLLTRRIEKTQQRVEAIKQRQ